ncbi:hypothetical protein CDAR_436631 [Caerostris darwini]|uniref:Uncharacterized protein n=1 Tax=Caerostris darwini TaxID=1538125 RepID=A0AAV4SAW6_9ARAC|nr:hypothetical protein CDAR_436631 [Caerostris darwini]
MLSKELMPIKLSRRTRGRRKRESGGENFFLGGGKDYRDPIKWKLDSKRLECMGWNLRRGDVERRTPDGTPRPPPRERREMQWCALPPDRRLLRGIEYIRYLFVRAIYLTTQSPRVDIVLYIVSERPDSQFNVVIISGALDYTSGKTRNAVVCNTSGSPSIKRSTPQFNVVKISEALVNTSGKTRIAMVCITSGSPSIKRY